MARDLVPLLDLCDPLNTSVVLTFCSLSLLDLAAYELLNRGGTDVRRCRKSSPPQAVALCGDSCRRGSRGAFCGVCPAARPAAATDGFSGPTAASGPAPASASGCPRRTGLVSGRGTAQEPERRTVAPIADRRRKGLQAVVNQACKLGTPALSQLCAPAAAA